MFSDSKKAGFNNSGSRTKITRRKERRHTLKYRLSETLLKYLLNYQISDSQVSMLSGLKFIPKPVTNECKIRQQLFQDFEQFTRRMRLQYIFHGQNKEPIPFHVKSNWIPPVQPSIALESD